MHEDRQENVLCFLMGQAGHVWLQCCRLLVPVSISIDLVRVDFRHLQQLQWEEWSWRLRHWGGTANPLGAWVLLHAALVLPLTITTCSTHALHKRRGMSSGVLGLRSALCVWSLCHGALLLSKPSPTGPLPLLPYVMCLLEKA